MDTRKNTATESSTSAVLYHSEQAEGWRNEALMKKKEENSKTVEVIKQIVTRDSRGRIEKITSETTITYPN